MKKLIRIVSKTIPTNEEEAFRFALDRFWQDVFRAAWGPIVKAAASAHGAEKFLENGSPEEEISERN